MLWQELFQEPVFVLTSDQDWAPSWAVERWLGLISNRGVQPHFFRTNPCPVLDAAAKAGTISQGWHPNFLPDSSHGIDVQAVLSYMKDNFPGVNTVRSHAFAENTYAWQELAKAGIIADSQTVTLFQPGLYPLLLPTGMVRFPVFFEDDIFFDYAPHSLDIKQLFKSLRQPGLKVLNFHATLVAANIPSRPYYSSVKSRIFSSTSQLTDVEWKGRGTLQVFEELVQAVFDAGFAFTPFPSLVEQTLEVLQREVDWLPFAQRFPGRAAQSRPTAL